MVKYAQLVRGRDEGDGEAGDEVGGDLGREDALVLVLEGDVLDRGRKNMSVRLK